MRWPWQRDLEAGSVLVIKEHVAELCPVAPSLRLSDLGYKALPADNLMALWAKYVDLSQFVYHGNSPEFPDCDDAARIAWADIIRGAAIERFTLAPAFGTISYVRKKDSALHMANWALVYPKGLPYFVLIEPQTRKMTGDLSDVVRVLEIQG